ncbi:MAG: aminotransferase class I/II-fold pyridoxal phosphate-dependent enzyme [Bacteroidales bacterium]|nr:aminotransferase class I/II-fold pyridoxal phosphate-dependent enzyme [Bacteroidales bacterium]
MSNIKTIRPADRLGSVSEYYFSRKLKEIAALNAAGADIISLGIGGPDLPPPAAAVSAAVKCLERPDTHGYQMTVGLPGLRRAFASWYERVYGIAGLDPDTEILPLIGSKEGVLNIALTFLNPGDGVMVPNPGYPTYTSASRIALAEVFSYELSPENDWQPDFEALERMPLERIKLMWVNYPHMPTGTPARRETFERLVDFGRRHGIVIVNDNPYSMILNPEPMSIFSVEGAGDIAIEMNSLSKCLNMAGWRVGVAVANARFIKWILSIKSNIDSGQPRAVMEGAVAALAQPAQWYAGLNDRYAERQRIAADIMHALGCEFREGQQGLFLWGRIPESETNAEAFADKVLAGARVFITPGFIFGSAGDRYVRVSLCARPEKLNEALERIKRWKI